MAQRELRVHVGCVKLHADDCGRGGSLADMFRAYTSNDARGRVLQIEFTAGETSGEILLKGDDIPQAEIEALTEALRSKIVEKMTTEVADPTPIPSAFEYISKAYGGDVDDGLATLPESE